MLALGCTEPKGPYSIAGTWEGSSVGQGTLHLELAHVGDRVSGPGYLRKAGAQEIAFVVDGTLRDSTLSSFMAGGLHFSATYRIEESNAGQFTAHFTTDGGGGFDGVVTRR